MAGGRVTRRIGMGLVGPGFVAAHHIDAARRLGYVEVIGIAGSSFEKVQERAAAWHVGRVYDGYAELIADPDVDVVHNTTPNHLHYEVTLAALKAGKHVISEKPLARTLEEAQTLLGLARKAGVAHVITFTYRGNAMVQQARAMVAAGEVGRVRFFRGHYLQDWLADPRAYSWRCDPKLGGRSAALADIGSHWCDLAEHVSGVRIESVLADFSTLVPVRYPGGGAQTFARAAQQAANATGAPGKGATVEVEDSASVLLRFAGGARGAFSVSQVLPGHKNDLELEISGAKASLIWQQERQSELRVGRFHEPTLLLGENPACIRPEAAAYMRLPEGHQPGWADALSNVIRDAYEWIERGARPEAKPLALPTFEDGVRSAALVESMACSFDAGGAWKGIE